MDKAPGFEPGDCRFESCHRQIFFLNILFSPDVFCFVR